MGTDIHAAPVPIVTGASSGIGLGITQALPEHGSRVVADLDRLKKLAKLNVLLATTEQFIEYAIVAEGASRLFVQIFGESAGHVRLVYGVQSLPIGAPVVAETIFEIV
ncbi:hypothetical protein CfE428DRAFT_6128 [Chthoniobacter flavus Ellin428]|uniref:Uncharacterized protein n=1 Tax=Chthoniobacter flavus Ellin428 TaxID=497964 RepID=B4DB37_9BACT|nr:RidA family protein [Chthoniobacter flavus]EDY16315.1 hypothetical protein CfE428DRAFT_6128 [Chthoniobacter flavus Ellin428]TCO90266.1 YjgF/chorismate_mutase-like putative endoribonuclease [Chthoniobacter flavus]